LSQRKKNIRMLAFALMTGGMLFLSYFFLPVVSYQLFLSRAFASDIETPIPKSMVGKDEGVMSLISQGMQSKSTDYRDARNWYPQVQHVEVEAKEAVSEYTLSIPKLKIDNAKVSRVDYDLSQQLVHYYGPPNPIEKGTSVIYGHSTLPSWFDPN